MVNEKSIRCAECNKEYNKLDNIFHCPSCGGPLDILYDYKKVKASLDKKEFLKQPANHWKYWMFYPVKSKNKVSMGEGGTPLIKSKLFDNVWFKYEGTNPTCSFKDRGSTIEVTKAVELGVKKVCCASTGNMGASVSAYCARAGIKCRIFLSGSACGNKVKQIQAHGAEIIQVKGDYMEALKECEDFAKKNRWYLMGDYPYRGEGEKSVAFEIADQMDWIAPSYVLAPMGNGTLIYAMWDAFQELQTIGLTDRLPKMIGFQSEGCSPIVNSYKKNLNSVEPVENPRTLATAIECGNPLDGKKALIALKDSEGFGETLTDSEILDAQILLAREEGIFVEPSGAVSVAGYLKVRKKLGGKIVCVLTGHGLKAL
ncbi:MAG: threonine synthase [Candidatus Aenigmarchaeota archaeon CG_4_10_14_0_8_um_filter_37_24]|nr:threonine synthase [Candidatus Aenigmarchaeota archaeon]OIN88184.1 MAG: threonine synthase [Candidatus Aenigmarchaeota archaeon CG1_02_38_14]PIV68659.1 MAG: threonine synthase [Candidatus Aenigmarchaeota archaeon CG01_land_8_20_14_3_00_37_9]PIW41116.1 MAG: threonine synthase [Candidatus Aenigmarchaeota archaeon CG15_BIG_FIL_POST_REV_8_21_14_020_37_27]PIX50905.1 MAG: threonine synthase [Candidatus Aenigmarchaeota archaeon CG_4_8_14_3_um_filter_37_24]PIY35701.1 MAG: threonine synthase [Candid